MIPFFLELESESSISEKWWKSDSGIDSSLDSYQRYLGVKGQLNPVKAKLIPPAKFEVHNFDGCESKDEMATKDEIN